MGTTKIRIPARRKPLSRAAPTAQLSNDGIMAKVATRKIRELRRMAREAEVDLPPDAKPEDVLPELLRNSLGYMRWARDLVGNLDVDAFWLEDPRTKERIPGAEFEFEMRCLAIAKNLCEVMIRFDIDKRGIVVEEAKVDILATALQEACKSAGLDEEQQKRVGSALRSQLRLIEGGAV